MYTKYYFNAKGKYNMSLLSVIIIIVVPRKIPILISDSTR